MPVRCLLVNPRFRVESFWNYRETCRAVGARYPAAPLSLITVAAMLPEDWELRLVDCNVETWRPDMLDQADIVLVGGMIVQQREALSLIREAKQRGKTVVVGGPDATSSPHLYAEADHLVLGEAELTLPRFLDDLARGRAKKTYADARQPDITTSPCPRFDLLDLDKYLHVGVQWCRGCPFTCEFCDIIELYGRRPRAKTAEQMLHEMQVLYDLGWRGHVDFVDDNFIGNKKLAKAFLPRLRDWLAERSWPFEFSTEASLNLADDDELLRLMQEVGFFSIFVGIESPDEETLVATKKRQNTRRSIVASIEKIHAHGMYVNAGYIIGFDTEKGRVSRGLIDCIQATAVPVNMVGMLYALPTTQLTRRLRAEGRLHEDNGLQLDGQGDQCTGGLNFDTLRPRSEILQDFHDTVEAVYEPAAYFERVQRAALLLDASQRRFKRGFADSCKALLAVARICWLLGVRRPARRYFWRVLWRVVSENPKAIHQAFYMCAMYIHHGPFSRYVTARAREAVAAAQEAERLRKRAPPVAASV